MEEKETKHFFLARNLYKDDWLCIILKSII